MAREIVSIASAPGWKARFVPDEGSEDSRLVTLVSWVVVETASGEREVVGVVQRSGTSDRPQGWLAFADEVDGFDGYAFTGLVMQAP
jgi:hypothetical protein